MIKKIFIALLFFSIIFFYSCNNKEEGHSTSTLNKNEFIKILIDIHQADAFLTTKSLFDNKITHTDSLSYYNQIFIKYGITREEFYNTVKYYLNDINKFIELQKVVIDSIDARYAYLDSIQKLSMLKKDLWNLKREWSLPEDGVTNAINFDLKIQKHGYYTLTAKIMSYPDDLSKGLKMKIIANYSDNTSETKEVKVLTKRAEWKEYSIVVQTNPKKNLKKIEGEILSHSNTTTYMHLQVKDIMLTYESKKEEIPENNTNIDTSKVTPK